MRPGGPFALIAALVAALTGALLAGCGSSPAPRAPAAPVPLSAQAYEHYLRGRIAMIEGQYGDAVRELSAASSAAPDEAPVHVALIEALRRAGHHDQARRAAERGQARWPHRAEIWLASGELYKARGGRDVSALRRAARAFERARELAPAEEQAYLGLASTHVAMRQPDRAEAVYRELLARVPASVAGHYSLARRLVQRRAYDQAEAHLRRALELDPEHLRARVALARVLRATGRKSQSIATLRQAFDRSGGDPRVGEELFRQLLEAGDRAEAVRLLGLLDRDDLDEQAKIAFGYLYMAIGEWEAAARLGQAIRNRRPVSGEARLLEASALAELRRLDDAVALLMEVAPERPAYPRCRAMAGELLARGGHIGRALDVVEQALALHPRHIDLVISQARVHELAGLPGRSRDIFRAALAARPRHGGLLYAFGMFEDRQGNPDRAVALMERILALYPDDPGALNFIGFSLADRDLDLARAERLLERAVELLPGDPFVLDSHGWLLFRQGRLDQARAVLARAVHLFPRDPELLWHLGEVLLARGERARALTMFERARGLRPEPRVRERIEARIQALRADR